MDTVTVSSKGQIAIPKEIRDKLGIHEGSLLLLDVQSDVITLRRDVSGWRELDGLVTGVDLISEYMAEKARDRERE
jgi:AbrB family looped-hinge helix DNA binding protein